MMHSKLALAAAAALVAAPALAQNVTASDPQSVAGALTAAGYQAQVKTDNVGDPLILSASSGTRFAIYFYDCTNNANCGSVQFHTAYDTPAEKTPTLDAINNWNRSQRFGRAYIDAEGDPAIEMDVDLYSGGMSEALFLDNLEFWVAVMAQFEDQIGW